MQNTIQLNKELLHIIKIPDILYTPYSLKKILIKKLNKKLYSEYYISSELQQFLNVPNNYIDIGTIENYLFAQKI